MLGVAPVPGGLYFFQPASQCPSSGWMLPSFLFPLGQSPFPFSWVLGNHVFVCRCTSFQFPRGKNNRRWLARVLFLSLPGCACCLLVGPLHLAFWIEVVFTSTFPSLSAFILETFTELVFQAGVCVCVSLSLCASVLGGEGLCDSLWDHRGLLCFVVSMTFQFVLHLSFYIFVQGILLWTLIFLDCNLTKTYSSSVLSHWALPHPCRSGGGGEGGGQTGRST